MLSDWVPGCVHTVPAHVRIGTVIGVYVLLFSPVTHRTSGHVSPLPRARAVDRSLAVGALSRTQSYAMDTATAIAQLKETMSAPAQEVACIVLRASGEVHELTIDHRKVSEVLGGVPTVVGGVRSLDVMAVALRDQKGRVTKHSLPDTFDKGIKGDIVLLRTDESATPVPFTSKEYKEWVDAGFPDEEQEEGSEEEGEEEEEDAEAEFNKMSTDQLKQGCTMMKLSAKGSRDELIARLVEATAEDEDEEESGEEGESDSDEEEEEEDVEATQEAIRQHVESLSKAELKDACEKLGLSSAGGEKALKERLLEAAKKGGSSAAAEEDSDDEEEEEEAPASAAPTGRQAGKMPVGKGKSRASPATAKGPKKTINKASARGLRA